MDYRKVRTAIGVALLAVLTVAVVLLWKRGPILTSRTPTAGSPTPLNASDTTPDLPSTDLRASSSVPTPDNNPTALTVPPVDNLASIAGFVVDSKDQPMGRKIDIRCVPANATTGETRELSCDLKGEFQFRELAPGVYRLWAFVPSWPDQPETSIALIAGQNLTGVRLKLNQARGETISGRVTNQAGRPVEGVSLTATATKGEITGRGNHADALTNSDGRFLLLDLKPQTYRVTASHQNYSRHDDTEVDATAENVDIVLDGFGAIAGRVIEANSQKPIKTFGATVSESILDAFPPGYRIGNDTFIDDEGKFRLEKVQTGDVTVLVSAKGFASTAEVVRDLRPGETTNVVVRLEPARAIEGTVRNDSGLPLAGAKVCFSPLAAAENGPGLPPDAITDESGRFKLDSLGNWPVEFFVSHSDYNVASVIANPTLDHRAPIDVILDHGGAIRGVVRVDGKPASGLDVYSQSSGFVAKPSQTKTDTSGAYVLPNVPTGPTQVSVMLPQALPSQECEVVSGQTTEVNIDLPAANAVLEGRITVNGKAPARGDNSAHIQIGSCIFSVEADGSYRLDGLPTGATIVYFSASPLNQMRRLLDLTDQRPYRLDIDFAAGNASLDGTISDAGRPVKRAEVCASVSTADDRREDFFTTADAHGHYHIDGLSPGSVAVQVTASRHVTRVVNVQTTADQPTRCDVELSGGTAVEGTLTGLRPGESARVVALQGDLKTNDIDFDKVYSLNAKYAEAFLREDGAFSLRGLAPGRYTLITCASAHSSHGTNATPRVVSATVDIAGENLTVDLTLPQ